MKAKRQIRLLHKLILLVVLTVVVTTVLPSVLVIRSVTRSLEEKVAEVVRTEARLGVAEVGRSLREESRRLLALATELDGITDDTDARRLAVRRWFELNDDALEVGWVPLGGRGAWRAARDEPMIDERIRTATPLDELTAYNRVGVAAEYAGGTGTLVLATQPSDPLSGWLVSTWRLAALSDLLRQFPVGMTGYLIVMDHRGFLVAHPHYHERGDPAGIPEYARLGADLRHLGVVRDAFEAAPQERMCYTNEAGHRVVAFGREIPGLGWAVIAQQPEHEALRAVDEIEQQVLAVGTTAGVVAILLGLATVRTITRPLEELAEAANRVGAGDLTHPVGVATRDEVGQLALAFNEMQIRLREMYDKLERMVAERTHELQETSDFLNSVLDSSTEYSIIATDLHGTILSYNEGARRIYGYEPEEIIGAPITILIPRDADRGTKSHEILQRVHHEGTFSGESTRVRKGGAAFPVRFVMTMRYDDAGNRVGYTTISRDITQQKEMEARLREYTENLEALVASKTSELQDANAELQRANRLKAEFLASMSHELRTPLNAIIGFAGVLRDGVAGPLNEDQTQCVADILGSGQQLLNLINDILDLSKVESGRMELIAEDVILSGIFDEVQTIVQGMAVRKGLSLSFEERPRGIVLSADRVKLLQILYNLLSNAVKFTPDGGSIRVEAERRTADVCFRVADSGVGIPEESLEMVFEEFRQVDARLSRQYGGTGLGLALTRKLVALHGGEITVESRVGEGTTFIFTIPSRLPPGGEDAGIFTSPGD